MYTPSDKLLTQGVESLSDSELLSFLLDDMSNCAEVSQRILDLHNTPSALTTMGISRLRMVEGIGAKRANRIIAAIEFGRRCHATPIAPIDQIMSSHDVVQLFKPHMSTLKHEECWVLYLNSTNRVVDQQRISQGGINTSHIDHRLVVKQALELLATQLVLIHNHPSGEVTPSSDDIAMTHRVASAAALFDITILDHIIISPNAEYSMLSGGDLNKKSHPQG